jgi:hypothetical protein
MISLLLAVCLAATGEAAEVQHLGVIGEGTGAVVFEVPISGHQPQRVDWTFTSPSGVPYHDMVETEADGIVRGTVRVREPGLWQASILVTTYAGIEYYQTCKKFDFVVLECGIVFLDGFESGDTSHWTVYE